jgi:hypothetical protein
MRRPGESELDYYERRYKERVNESTILNSCSNNDFLRRLFKQRLSRSIRPVQNPYDADAQLMTGNRQDKSPTRRITGGRK